MLTNGLEVRQLALLKRVTEVVGAQRHGVPPWHGLALWHSATPRAWDLCSFKNNVFFPSFPVVLSVSLNRILVKYPYLARKAFAFFYKVSLRGRRVSLASQARRL